MTTPASADAPRSDGEIVITDYEDWMHPQVIDLFLAEYGLPRDEQERFLAAFYEHPFQRGRAVRSVALSGDEVAGFQTFFYWPYTLGNRELCSYQSGGSLVSPRHRGKGIYGRMFQHCVDESAARGGVFAVGFPVDAAYGATMRFGWTQMNDLEWLIRPLHPLALAFPTDIDRIVPAFDVEPERVEVERKPNVIALSDDPDFEAWRANFSARNTYYHFHYRCGVGTTRFDLKLDRRGRMVEFVVGNIVSSSFDPQHLEAAIRELVRKTKSERAIAVLSIAVNAAYGDPAVLTALRRNGFFPIRKKIHTILLELDCPVEARNPENWRLFRADIDTW